jgi:hypothetical protein
MRLPLQNRLLWSTVQDNGVFLALAAVVMSLVGVPVLQQHGYGLVGIVSAGVLALSCVGVLYDRLTDPPY